METARATDHEFCLAGADRLGCIDLAYPRPRWRSASTWANRRLAHLRSHIHGLAQGCRDKAELARLKQGLASRNTDVLQVTPAISQRAAELVDSLALSHGMRLADALIGATAIEHGATLITANTRHFGVVRSLDVEAFVP